MRGAERGRRCHSTAVPVTDPDRLAGAGGPFRLWVDDVPADAGSAAAASRLDRELRRPVDPGIGPPVRTVLLRYADGPADLVVVADRSRVGALEPVVAAILGSGPPATGDGAISEPRDAATVEPGAAAFEPGDDRGLEPQAPAVPDWGLGDPSAGPEHEAVEFDLTAVDAAGPSSPLAALGLVLARYGGQGHVVVGGLEPDGAVALEADEDRTVGEYLRSVREAATIPARPEDPPLAGLVVTGPIAAGPFAAGRYLPFLTPPHPLTFHVRRDGDGGAVATCWYLPRLIAPEIAGRLVRHLASAHRHLAAAAPGTPLREVELFDPEEQRRIVELGGAGRTLSFRPEVIHRVVAARAAERPDGVAVSGGGGRLTYRELDQRAGRLADALRALGVARGHRVGVCLDRSPELVVVLLAVLRSGAAYVPMDPAYPDDRLAYMASDAGPAVVVTTRPGFPAAPGVPVLSPESLRGVSGPAASPPDGAAGERRSPGDAAGEPGTPDDAAYVIYTSGSTGRPKGVVVPHRNVVALLASTGDELGLGPNDCWSQFHSAAFDFSVWEIWGCLMTGGRLVVVPHGTTRSPEEFAALLDAEGVTVLSQTPSAFTQLAAVDAGTPLRLPPRLVVFGGEPLDTRPLLAWFDRHPEGECRLVNMYGITETTVHVTAQPLSRREALAGSRSVGRPLAGWYAYVLDRWGRLVPPGVDGEIHVGGEGVADGYLNLPELTAERFRTDPFAAGGPARAGRLYRSGDRGRLLPDGRLEHLGRLDGQVKLRGHRIELDEIRACLLEAPGVGAAAVLLRQPVPSDPATARIDAYVVFRGLDGDVGAVRRHAARFLPDYMVPSAVVALPALPLTSNGKVDLGRLPEPGPAGSPEDDEAADGTVQGAVLAAWGSVFGLRVRPDDDFFSLGGNSLLAVRLSAALRSRGLPPISLPALYLNPTVAGLVALLSEAPVRQPA